MIIICYILKNVTFLLQCPTTVEEWLSVAHNYGEEWNFGLCLGAIDGKHIMIRKPACSGSMYFNYKHFCSVILLAVCDAHYKFLFCDVGSQGRCSDAGVFAESDLNLALQDNIINIPKENKLPGTDIMFPYCFVADEAFPLREYIMKPYPQRQLNKQQQVYNYRISRARRCIENAFGILANRFRVFLQPICVRPSKVKKIVMACCCLHNMLRTVAPNSYTVVTDDNVDTGAARPGTPVGNLPPARVSGRRTSTQAAKNYRDILCAYFNSEEGKVDWQENMI